MSSALEHAVSPACVSQPSPALCSASRHCVGCSVLLLLLPLLCGCHCCCSCPQAVPPLPTDGQLRVSAGSRAAQPSLTPAPPEPPGSGVSAFTPCSPSRFTGGEIKTHTTG